LIFRDVENSVCKSGVLSKQEVEADALGDLLRAALQIADGGQQAWCSFDREPPEWRLLLDRDIDPELLFVRVLEFPDSYTQRAPEGGQLCFSSDCSSDRFARAVCSAAAAVLSEKGEDGYSEWWGLPFPERALSSLKATLAA
jgi:hypothetical protein